MGSTPCPCRDDVAVVHVNRDERAEGLALERCHLVGEKRQHRVRRQALVALVDELDVLGDGDLHRLGVELSEGLRLPALDLLLEVKQAEPHRALVCQKAVTHVDNSRPARQFQLSIKRL